MNEYATIGGLADALTSLNQDARVYVDNEPPLALSSYRGYYSDLAIQTGERTHPNTETALSGLGSSYHAGHSEVAIKSEPTVADLVKALELAIGEEFEGYKGGQFRMASHASLWVSEYGRCEGKQVVGIEFLPSANRVDLVTTVVE